MTSPLSRPTFIGSLDGAMVAIEDESLHGVTTDAEGCGLTEDQLGEGVGLVGMAEDFEDPAGAPPLHDGGGEGGIECACGEDGIECAGGMLRGKIIQVAAKFDDFIPFLCILD